MTLPQAQTQTPVQAQEWDLEIDLNLWPSKNRPLAVYNVTINEAKKSVLIAVLWKALAGAKDEDTKVETWGVQLRPMATPARPRYVTARFRVYVAPRRARERLLAPATLEFEITGGRWELKGSLMIALLAAKPVEGGYIVEPTLLFHIERANPRDTTMIHWFFDVIEAVMLALLDEDAFKILYGTPTLVNTLLR